MLQNYTAKQKFTIILLMFIFAGFTSYSQEIQRPQPKWWFGESVAANFNYYVGTTQMLNQNLTVPAAFHKGYGVRPYASLLTEYRPNKTWGGMLNIAFDNRGGKYTGVVLAPCNCLETLATNVSYITIEPSLRLAPFKSAFYVFAGPTININVSKEFMYTQEKQPDTRADWSDINKTVISAQAGLGFDIPVSSKTSNTQMTISPFASFQTDLFQTPRSVESWSIYTIRAGIALKFGSVKRAKAVAPIQNTITDTVRTTVAVAEKEIQFSVRAPKVVPLNRQVRETFPIRNSVFFDMGSTDIPKRYVILNADHALLFREEQLQKNQPDNLNNGRSARQLAVYHNILNILGDRMRANPTSTITLVGSSDKNPVEGKILAENVKDYLVVFYKIDPSRITTEGRDKPIIASEQLGAVKYLDLLREGDRRVDIVSTSPELLLQVGGNSSSYFKPIEITSVQQDPLDGDVIFTVANGSLLLDSWTVEFTDEQGNVQSFGPYSQDQASVSGKMILGNNTQGNYKIVMIGKTRTGQTIRKESYVSLMKMGDVKQEGLRYTILFDFDKSKTIESYEKFLTEIVTPLIPEYGTVIIHGHTDVIGDEKYNLNLSVNRAKDAQQIIEKALSNSGKKGVKFESYGFGKDANMAPFDNNLPEERFYNRTVIIDIIPAK